MSLEILEYIAESPPREAGGFHEQTIAAAAAVSEWWARIKE